MAKGLGDFVVVTTQTAIRDWASVSQSMRWPKIGALPTSVKYKEIQGTTYIAWTGDVAVTESSNQHIIVELTQRIDQCSPEKFIQNPQKNNCFFGKFVRVETHGLNKLVGYTDALRQYTLYYYCGRGLAIFATDLRLVSSLQYVPISISPQSIYHYLNFSYVPTPFTIYKDIYKIPAGHRITLSAEGQVDLKSYWQPKYPETLTGSEKDMAQELSNEINTTISHYGELDGNFGCFLSGGTDSSTITGILATSIGAANVNAYSIGFCEEGYDELEYAEMAAKYFGVQHHKKRVSADESFDAINILLRAYDEPFGNSSSIPVFCCAKLATEHAHYTLIAGDGGDEIFGGNERYAKDFWFHQYYSLPTFFKSAGHLIHGSLKPFDQRFANRVKNFLYRASLPNPKRFYTDDSFASEYYDTLLSADFRSNVDQISSLTILEDHFDRCNARSELNKLMYIDLQMALADNDLVKVNRAAKAVGVSVIYPYLSPSLVQYMGKIPHHLKVKGTQKRYLFKKAVSNILPEEILRKKKQGFGLPVGEWFRTERRYREMLYDNLLSQRARERGYFNQAFIETLMDRHDKRVWEYTQELWLLLMLELWHQNYNDQNSEQRDAA